MVSGHIFHCRKNSWLAEEYVGRTALQLLDFDGGAPPEQAWWRKLNSHANLLKVRIDSFERGRRRAGLDFASSDGPSSVCEARAGGGR